MTRHSTFPLYDRILDGKLPDLLRDWRNEGMTPSEMRDLLRDRYDITVAVETVRRWVRIIEREDATDLDGVA